jgi:ATP-dependent exoDNAse (exonuclease V) alpha subunit
MMTDSEILEKINQETQEEHELLHAGEHGAIDEAERTRLTELKTSLDQLWDLLRQRRALRHAGLNPDNAEERSASTVEHYKQ